MKKNILRLIVIIVLMECFLLYKGSFGVLYGLFHRTEQEPSIITSSSISLLGNLIGAPVMQENKELGVALPPNVVTEWEVEDLGYAKAVVYYSDPHKLGYPPYQEGKSPDIEKIVCINSGYIHGADEDPFVGSWITGLNDFDNVTVRDRWYYFEGVRPAEKYDRSVNHSFSELNILGEIQPNGSRTYSVRLDRNVIYEASDKTITKYKNEGKNPISEALKVYFGCNGSGYERFQKFSIEGKGIRVDKNTMYIHVQENQSGSEYVDFELIYHPDDNTLEVAKCIDTTQRDICGDFNRRKHHDILKRYAFYGWDGYIELKEALVQLKIDQIHESYPEFSGYKNMMLSFKHTETIPGTFDPTKKPKMPEPEFPSTP